MKKTVLTLLALVAIGTFFSACERADYQHPLHRSNNG